MPNLHLQDFDFVRMWPRRLFHKKNKTGLIIRQDVDELQRPGVYVLYKGDELYYVGKATNLFSRLHSHSNKITDDYYAHWTYFSAFALKKTVTKADQRISELEAILIAAMPRATNKAAPRFNRVRIPRSLMADSLEAASSS
jgi:predicted GIY-YIG superfamily endonuclease